MKYYLRVVDLSSNHEHVQCKPLMQYKLIFLAKDILPLNY